MASGPWLVGPEQPPYLAHEFRTALEVPRSAQSGSLFNEAAAATHTKSARQGLRMLTPPGAKNVVQSRKRGLSH